MLAASPSEERILSIVSSLTELHAEVDTLRSANQGAEAGREFALAATALEDAIMRVNRGFAKANNTFKVADVEADNA